MEMEDNRRKNHEEFTELFSDFLMELKQENDQFLTIINAYKEQSNSSVSPKDIHVFKDETDQDTINQDQPISSDSYSRLLAFQSYDQNTRKAKNDGKDIKSAEYVEKTIEKTIEETIKEMSFDEQVVNLEQQGLTVDEIAKALNKGKTEIELMLKFRRKSR